MSTCFLNWKSAGMRRLKRKEYLKRFLNLYEDCQLEACNHFVMISGLRTLKAVETLDVDDVLGLQGHVRT